MSREFVVREGMNIAAVIAEARAAGGAVVVLPHGSWMVSRDGTVVLASGMRLTDEVEGEGTS